MLAVQTVFSFGKRSLAVVTTAFKEMEQEVRSITVSYIYRKTHFTTEHGNSIIVSVLSY